jgi:hypothetical protein
VRRHPFDYDAVGHRGERMVDAHRFFSEQARQWLAANGPDAISRAGGRVSKPLCVSFFKIVVIDLTIDENATGDFRDAKTPAARRLTACRPRHGISSSSGCIEKRCQRGGGVFRRTGRSFETGFWETEVSVGRLRYPRSSIFLNHWLIARTGENVPAREVFDEFKRFARPTIPNCRCPNW